MKGLQVSYTLQKYQVWIGSFHESWTLNAEMKKKLTTSCRCGKINIWNRHFIKINRVRFVWTCFNVSVGSSALHHWSSCLFCYQRLSAAVENTFSLIYLLFYLCNYWSKSITDTEKTDAGSCTSIASKGRCNRCILLSSFQRKCRRRNFLTPYTKIGYT